MTSSSRPAPRERGATTDASGPAPMGMLVLAWLVPGAAHAWLGQMRKAAVFFVVLSAMFVIGAAFGGRLFPFQVADPLVFLAAAAQWGLGAPRLIASLAGVGPGDVTAMTYEYGNTFLMTAGLLNVLVALNAFDLASARKS